MAYNIGARGGFDKPLGRPIRGGGGPMLIATGSTATAASSGLTLTVFKGSFWAGVRHTTGFQWYRGTATIANATNSTFALSNSDSGKTVTAQVWATNVYGKYVNNNARLAVLLP